jgi:hypothetical protein
MPSARQDRGSLNGAYGAGAQRRSGQRRGHELPLRYFFCVNDEQKRIAEDTIAHVEASGLWPGKVVTEPAPVGPFWEAEPEHQDYLETLSGRLHLSFRATRLEASTPRGSEGELGRVIIDSSHLPSHTCAWIKNLDFEFFIDIQYDTLAQKPLFVSLGLKPRRILPN